MIKFKLRCSNDHEFESWFQQGAAFDAQAGAGLIACPICQSTEVSKAIMSPALARGDRTTPSASSPQAGPDAAQNAPPQSPSDAAGSSGPVAIFSAADAEMREMMAELRRRVLENSSDLGEKFAEEALKIHLGFAPNRPIHGQASVDDVRLLIEEGVRIMPIPPAPGEFN